MPVRYRFRQVTIAALAAGACALATPVRGEERAVSGFDEVLFSVPGELRIVQGRESLQLEGDPDALKRIVTEVRGGRLVIKRESSFWSIDDGGRVRAQLGVELLSELAVAGSGRAFAERLETGDLQLKVSGSGHIEIERLDAEDLEIRISGSGSVTVPGLQAADVASSISGSGTVTLGGAARVLDLRISGSGDFRGGELATGTAAVVVSGAGDVEIRAEDQLDVAISGSGSVKYWGKPSVSQVVSGSGSVRSAR
jgi:hypothetical protein